MNKNTYLGLIIARGGSKGLPLKNVLPCAGKPLINWTIEAAQSSNCFDRIILSTDDEKIANAAISAGCEVPFIRPKSHAQDSSTVAEVIHHALSCLKEKYSHLVLLQATSPCRKPEHIQEAIEKYEKNSFDTLISVCRAPEKAGWILKESDNGQVRFILQNQIQQRQKLPRLYYPNGAIYITDSLEFRDSFYGSNTGYYEMPQNDSIDVDTKEDLDQAQRILARP